MDFTKIIEFVEKDWIHKYLSNNWPSVYLTYGFYLFHYVHRVEYTS
jgi:hypothetical protein